MLDAGAAVWRKAEPMMTPGQSDLAAAHRGPRADDMDDDSDSSDAEHGGGDLQEVDDDVLLGRQQKQQQRAQDPGVTAMAAQLAALQVCSHCVLTLCVREGQPPGEPPNLPRRAAACLAVLLPVPPLSPSPTAAHRPTTPQDDYAEAWTQQAAAGPSASFCTDGLEQVAVADTGAPCIRLPSLIPLQCRLPTRRAARKT